MELENYINYEYLFFTMCLVLAFMYFKRDNPTFIIRYK